MIILYRGSSLDNEEKLLFEIEKKLSLNPVVRIYIPPCIDNGNSNISAVFVISKTTQITSKKRKISFNIVVNFSKNNEILTLERKKISLSKIVVLLRDFLHNKKPLNDIFTGFEKI